MLSELGFSKTQLRAMFTYLFRGMSYMELREYFADGIAAKHKFDNNGYVLMNCKLYAWAHWNGVGTAKEYGVSKHDTKLLKSLDLSFVNKGYKVWKLQEFRDTVEGQLFNPSMDTYIGKFISKKLIFLRSYGLTRHDIANDLSIAGMYSVYRMFPMYKSVLHIQNIAKMAIKREGKELIYRNTTKRKQALMRNADGTFESRLVPWEAAVNSGQVNLVTSSVFDITSHAIRLSKAYQQCTPRAKRFLQLLTGERDEEFSKFLGAHNDQAFESMDFDSYVHSVQMHLGVTDGQRDRFFAKIRRV